MGSNGKVAQNLLERACYVLEDADFYYFHTINFPYEATFDDTLRLILHSALPPRARAGQENRTKPFYSVIRGSSNQKLQQNRQ